MKNAHSFFKALILLFSLALPAIAHAENKSNAENTPSYSGLCAPGWTCDTFTYHPHSNPKISAEIRRGYLEAKGDTFRGNILYFEGLGDSMMNHGPLFSLLTAEGFRVIAFDYMGQGKSTGDMVNTRIYDIPKLGDLVWEKYALNTTHFPKKNIIGWSTGGLAAYYAAAQKKADLVVMIAPGIAAKPFVGEQHFETFQFDLITPETLSNARYPRDGVDPHLDQEIRPNSPMKVLFGFGTNLLWTSHQSEKWKISPSIPGFVLLSGKDDTYVDGEKANRILHGTQKNQFKDAHALHFEVSTFDQALHEIDNEAPDTADCARTDIVTFIKTHQ